jgi:hypothetical protein
MKITAAIYDEHINKPVRVVCTDGQSYDGIWIDHTSELDNEPDGESITLRTAVWPYFEIYVDEIERIEAV